MTTPREIIATDFERYPVVGPYLDIRDGAELAERAIEALTAAGYRILGPDELDDVTLEKAAEAAENASMRVSYGILSQERDEPILHRTVIASLIRALGRKA